MILFPNAKINLGLNIIRRRNDGYHDIETVFYPIPINDILEIVPSVSGATTLTTTGNIVACPPEKNLVMKAYNLLASQYNIAPVDMYLHKIIPDGAGLGGGSSDASSALIILNKIAELNLSNEILASTAAKIGADCPFFIHNTPLLAKGIGNIFEHIDISLSGKYLVLIKPDISIPTAIAYSNVAPAENEITIHEILSKPIAEWKQLLKNDFEKSIFTAYPQLAHIKQALYDEGAVYASMSGSGSSIFGIFESAIMAEASLKKFACHKCFIMILK